MGTRRKTSVYAIMKSDIHLQWNAHYTLKSGGLRNGFQRNLIMKALSLQDSQLVSKKKKEKRGFGIEAGHLENL